MPKQLPGDLSRDYDARNLETAQGILKNTWHHPDSEPPYMVDWARRVLKRLNVPEPETGENNHCDNA